MKACCVTPCSTTSEMIYVIAPSLLLTVDYLEKEKLNLKFLNITDCNVWALKLTK